LKTELITNKILIAVENSTQTGIAAYLLRPVEIRLVYR